MCVVAPEDADGLTAKMRQTKEGRNACIIGEVSQGPEGVVVLNTSLGGNKILDKLVGEQLPRIC